MASEPSKIIFKYKRFHLSKKTEENADFLFKTFDLGFLRGVVENSTLVAEGVNNSWKEILVQEYTHEDICHHISFFIPWRYIELSMLTPLEELPLLINFDGYSFISSTVRDIIVWRLKIGK